ARADARFRDIPLQLELEPSLPRVVVDAVQIEQVILNLVRNAVVSCLAAECHEPIRIATELAESELVEVSISDRGLGLTEAEQDRLFEAFYSTKDSGLGMGLTISRSIVSSFGGRLWCTADESGGATFRFSLPVAVGEEVRELGPTAATST
ncbi:MAG: ATP-binding protein, partial [Thermoanaerobaculia bacterium]